MISFNNLNIFQTETLKAGGGEEHGALVQQILETQKELEEPKKKTLGGVEIVSIHNCWTENFYLFYFKIFEIIYL